MANSRQRSDTSTGTDDNARDRVAVVDEHLSSGIERASDGALAAVSAIEERSRAAIEIARQRANDARQTLERLEREATGQFDRTTDQVSTLVREKPLQAAGVAFAAGVLATLILRKR